MARRIDRNGHPVGSLFWVFEFPARLQPRGLGSDAMVAVPGRFIGAISQFSSNIWMLDLPKKKNSAWF
jgi:hypothetical protein